MRKKDKILALHGKYPPVVISERVGCSLEYVYLVFRSCGLSLPSHGRDFRSERYKGFRIRRDLRGCYGAEKIGDVDYPLLISDSRDGIRLKIDML